MKLKCLFLTVAALLFLFNGCNKDAFFGEEPDVVLKKANVPIPLKGEVCMTLNNEERIDVHFGSPDGPVVPGATLAKIAWLSGNMTHMGKLGEESWMECREGAYLDAVAFNQGKKIVVATYDARLFAANGNYIDLVSNIRIDRDAQTLTADYLITGGSGNFENAAGSGLLSGTVHCWDVEGTLEYPRD
jgi:hypothetical protein